MANMHIRFNFIDIQRL